MSKTFEKKEQSLTSTFIHEGKIVNNGFATTNKKEIKKKKRLPNTGKTKQTKNS